MARKDDSDDPDTPLLVHHLEVDSWYCEPHCQVLPKPNKFLSKIKNTSRSLRFRLLHICGTYSNENIGKLNTIVLANCPCDCGQKLLISFLLDDQFCPRFNSNDINLCFKLKNFFSIPVNKNLVLLSMYAVYLIIPLYFNFIVYRLSGFINFAIRHGYSCFKYLWFYFKRGK